MEEASTWIAPPPLRIGDVTLAGNVLLAPIAGYCDVSFRLVARSCGGVALACTDLLCPEGVLRENKRSMELAATCPEDSPLSIQLYGADPQRLCEAAKWAADHGADIIDINMGCPVDKITKRDGGSALLCDIPRTLDMAQRVVRAVPHIPVTAKLRLGWDEHRLVAPFLANRLEQVGIAAVTVHGRTTEMRFHGAVRLDGIAAVVAAVDKIPIIGNGDIRAAQDAKQMITATGCAGVMIGRAALAAPWVLRDVQTYLQTGVLPPPPTIQQKCQYMRDHFYNMIRFRNQRVAILEFRKRVSWYAKHMNPCRVLRDAMRVIDSMSDFEAAVDNFLAWRARWELANPHFSDSSASADESENLAA